MVAVCLGSALLSYKTFVIAPAIEAQIGVVAFALGLHQTILGEIEETVAKGYHACGATRTLPSPYLAACRGFATTHQGEQRDLLSRLHTPQPTLVRLDARVDGIHLIALVAVIDRGEHVARRGVVFQVLDAII